MSFTMDRALFNVIAPGVIQRISDSATIHNASKGLPPSIGADGGFSTVQWADQPFTSDPVTVINSPTKAEAAAATFAE